MEEKLKIVFGTGSNNRATMGSRTGVVIGSGPTGGWTGAVLCEQEGCTWSFVTSGSVPDPLEVEAELQSGAEAWFFFVKSNARTISLSSSNIRHFVQKFSTAAEFIEFDH
ncbi:hypothetical protein Tco_0823369 [Tanacetum coccineum]|uniref:Uncharacterized protein n=1 Tax=Tanacetum coccineum TaxID=301880 RepID=A0ABQ5AHQ8_9ASTR